MHYSKIVKQGILPITCICLTSHQVFALPPPEDIPEEILRGEIVTEGRSPIDGHPLTLQEYVQLREEISQGKFPPNLSEELRYQVFMLQLLHFLDTFTPF